ncbi:MAG: sugar phosphate isomerase/epimerase family protein [Rhodothermales bacterium]|nr:sugar phosphate isomerase/epimerase family protein [Rhodothermales bacterium]
MSSRLCLHTITTKPWPIETAIDAYAAAGIGGISVWRDALDGRSIPDTGRRIREAGLTIVSYVRGGFFAALEAEGRAAAIDENKRVIDEAAALGAPLVVLVCGAAVGQSLEESRRQIRAGIEAVLPHARERGVKLAIEPLHPMYADTRSAIVTLGQANGLVEAVADDHLGVAVDVYHVWWDPALAAEIARCGDRILAFHVCDWRSPTRDLLNDRGLMGEGCIPIRQIRRLVEKAGFAGFIEVEIFSTEYWAMDQHVFLDRIVDAYKHHV